MSGMRRIAVGLALLATLAAGQAAASAPESSIRPTPRPAADAPATRAAPVLAAVSVQQSPRPEVRPRSFIERLTVRAAGVRTQPAPDAIIGRQGAVCGVRDIEGARLAPIAGRVQGCGIEEPVRVTSVGGVALSNPATIDCNTALALRAWVKDAVLPTVGQTGGGVARLEVAASYVCRPRNNQAGARISEHGRGTSHRHRRNHAQEAARPCPS
jgi:hypothetical protein